MTVSIVIPCYNQAQYLNESVQSALNQTYSDVEIIIVNDGSTDNTLEIAQKMCEQYPSIRVVNQGNKGLSEARNSGIRNANGTFILPLDADDKLDKEMITRCMDVMIRNNADIVYSEWECFGEDNSIIHRKSFDKVNILYENQPAPSSLYRKSVWQTIDGYKINMDGGYEDWEFWINAYKHNFKFYNVPEILFYYRVKKESMYTEAAKKDAYLKAKIVMNHPELYTSHEVDEAIYTIKETEKLSDLYLYSSNEELLDNQQVIISTVDYLANHKLLEKQILTMGDKKIALCTLDIFDNIASIEKLSQEMDVELILFYASLRYEVAELQCLDIAWDFTNGFVPIKGTVFEYVTRSKREDMVINFLKSQRSQQYIQEKYQSLEDVIHQKDQHILTLEVQINNQEQEIKKLQEELALIYTSKSWKYTKILQKLKKSIWTKK